MKKLHASEPDADRVHAFHMSILDELRAISETGSKKGAADKLSADRGNLSARIEKFKSDWPRLSAVVDAIRDEGLLEKTSTIKMLQKQKKSKMEKAERGFYVGSHLSGYRIVGGVPVEIPDELRRVKRVFDGFRREYKGKSELAREEDIGFSKSTIYNILTDARYKGDYSLYGKQYRITQGDFKPLLTPEEWDEIQSLIHTPKGGYRLSRILYRWKTDRFVARPGAKKIATTVLKMHTEGKSLDAICGILKKEGVTLGRETIRKILKDMRITGRMLSKDGKLVDSGYEPLVEIRLWKNAQRVKIQDAGDVKRKKGAEHRKNVIGALPAYRWEICKITDLSRAFVEFLVNDLKRHGIIHERDGLLQLSINSFPEKVLSTVGTERSQKRAKILQFLLEGGKSSRELLEKTRITRGTFTWELCQMRTQGILDSRPTGFRAIRIYSLSDEWLPYVRDWLSKSYIKQLEMSQLIEFDYAKIRDRILAVLVIPATPSEIAVKTHIPIGTVKWSLRKLMGEGIVEKRREPGRRFPVYIKLLAPQKS